MLAERDHTHESLLGATHEKRDQTQAQIFDISIPTDELTFQNPKVSIKNEGDHFEVKLKQFDKSLYQKAFPRINFNQESRAKSHLGKRSKLHSRGSSMAKRSSVSTQKLS